MAKSLDERVDADIKKAQIERQKKKLTEDYEKYVRKAGSDQDPKERQRYRKMAKECRARLDKLEGKSD